MDLGDTRRYVELRRRQKELEAEAKAIKDEADALEQSLLEDFASEGLDRMTVDGNTVYLHRQLWAKVANDVSRSEVVSAMKEAGASHFVHETYNHQTISAWLRELESEGEELPAELQGLIEGHERYSLRVRRT